MGKRSDFPRRKMDNYATPHKAMMPVVPFLQAEGIRTFSEPCCGRGDLVDHLICEGFECVYAGDIRNGQDAFERSSFPGDAIITNPPWTRQIMHPLITHFMSANPVVWLLFDADWAHTHQAWPLLPHCTHIVSVGRIKWIPGSKHTGKDNAAWYRFERGHREGPRFFGSGSLVRKMEEAA